MGQILSRIKPFIWDETGVTAIEYAMIGAIMSIAVILGATSIGVNLEDSFYGKLASAMK